MKTGIYYKINQFVGFIGLVIILTNIEVSPILKTGIFLFGLNALMLLLDIRGILLDPEKAKRELLK